MSLQMSTKYNYRVIGCGFFSGMALLSFKADGDEVDIVCGALCAKFQTENLSSGFSCYISFGGRSFTTFEFEHHAPPEIGNYLFVVMVSLYQILLSRT